MDQEGEPRRCPLGSNRGCMGCSKRVISDSTGMLWCRDRPHIVSAVTSGQRRLPQWSCATAIVLVVAALFVVVHQEDQPLRVHGQTVGDTSVLVPPTTPATSTTTTANPAAGPTTTTSTTDSPRRALGPSAPPKAKSSKVSTLPGSALFPTSTTTSSDPCADYDDDTARSDEDHGTDHCDNDNDHDNDHGTDNDDDNGTTTTTSEPPTTCHRPQPRHCFSVCDPQRRREEGSPITGSEMSRSATSVFGDDHRQSISQHERLVTGRRVRRRSSLQSACGQ